MHVSTNSMDKCKSCLKSGHKSARSPNCENHVLSKQEVFRKNLDQGYQAFTRKLPFDKCVRIEHINNLKSKIIAASRDVRNITVRAQIFANYFITLRSQQADDNSIPHCIFTQQFWYSVCQLVSGRRVTNSASWPTNMTRVWDAFRSFYNNIVYRQQIASGTSQCLAEACTQLATSYQNNIVEHFESRLLNFLYYRLQNIFMVNNRYCIYRVLFSKVIYRQWTLILSKELLKITAISMFVKANQDGQTM